MAAESRTAATREIRIELFLIVVMALPCISSTRTSFDQRQLKRLAECLPTAPTFLSFRDFSSDVRCCFRNKNYHLLSAYAFRRLPKRFRASREGYKEIPRPRARRILRCRLTERCGTGAVPSWWCCPRREAPCERQGRLPELFYPTDAHVQDWHRRD